MRTFTINDKQEQDYKTWATEHQKTCGARPDISMALYLFTFLPTGLGDQVHVECPCGAKVYLDTEEEL